MNDSVLFEELTSHSGKRIGVATLNRPETLNGLSLEMCQLLDARLVAWQADPAVVAVVMRGAGDRALSAGGDLHGLYRGMLDAPDGDAWAIPAARDFFSTEYRLDYRIHTYAKPILCWGSGIVMGGGVGLLQGASHRVVTETTRYAMPEITIGLYPDVAGTWMLARMPRGIGLFLALTGAQLGASDCLHYGLADYMLPATSGADLLRGLQALHWDADSGAHAAQVDALLDGLQAAPDASGPLQAHAALIRQICNRADLGVIAQGIEALKAHEDPWLQRAAKTFLAGSPGSARLSMALLEHARHASLADVFRTEFVASLHCCAEPDFREGIRALLIDKDKAPRWQPASLEQASEQWVQRFFEVPWPDGETHPLADLGVEALPAAIETC
ncbi:enoyl-CoA hydratase/isomerase family protein [Castellaniella sp.]|uniref:enoyl-CoA hydratase/isomerase family protein n=1 Tax=Castellaniella sp. TaxID=1955812 RepID=UPI00355F4100